MSGLPALSAPLVRRLATACLAALMLAPWAWPGSALAMSPGPPPSKPKSAPKSEPQPAPQPKPQATPQAPALEKPFPVCDKNARQDERSRMVEEQIRARGIKDPRVLAAMLATPRHCFVPPAERPLAYADHPLPIGYGQTISQPYVVALMSEYLKLKPKDKVLEIGTGSGYQAAILAQLAGEVHSIEIVPELGQRAAKILIASGYQKVSIRIGDGYKGWYEKSPFDAIILTAAPEKIPPALKDQLAPGGRMILPLGPSGGVQELIILKKSIKGQISRESLGMVRFVPMVPGHPDK
jgi:protein-L-isoaspartate(D-aspartate) O-methyltransferase